jgi:hypothetical protein
MHSTSLDFVIKATAGFIWILSLSILISYRLKLSTFSLSAFASFFCVTEEVLELMLLSILNLMAAPLVVSFFFYLTFSGVTKGF